MEVDYLCNDGGKSGGSGCNLRNVDKAGGRRAWCVVLGAEAVVVPRSLLSRDIV